MSNKPIFSSKHKDPDMIAAFIRAQETFPYFWRELTWEYRRMVRVLQVAAVKVAFMDDEDSDLPVSSEMMWVDEIDFDGEFVYGVLNNEPHHLRNIKAGDSVQVPMVQVVDWLFVLQNKSYGGFTIQVLRDRMNEEERAAHDKAWGFDFGDTKEVLLAYEQLEHPENLEEHPMSRSARQHYEEFFTQNPQEINGQDEFGYTPLHKETIAGNRTIVEVLLSMGAQKDRRTYSGKTAFDFAKQLDWKHLIELLK